jgi:hypothetical protein
MTAHLPIPMAATPLLLAASIVFAAPVPEARLPASTEDGWTAYVNTVEHRRSHESAQRDRFLALDFLPARTEELSDLLAGRVVAAPMRASASDGAPLEVPGAMVHHWRGAIFIPDVTVAGVMKALQQGPPAQDDVLRSRVLARGPGWMKVYLRLRRSKIVTVVYDTEHLVRFDFDGASRAGSTTTLIGVAEVEAPGTPGERLLPTGEDRGFLWRLNAYWKYLAVPGGVIAECESITLSRGIPFGLRTITRPLIDSTARDSIATALRAVREGVTADSTRPSSSPAR